jgi:hypothetical protein
VSNGGELRGRGASSGNWTTSRRRVRDRPADGPASTLVKLCMGVLAITHRGLRTHITTRIGGVSEGSIYNGVHYRTADVSYTYAPRGIIYRPCSAKQPREHHRWCPETNSNTQPVCLEAPAVRRRNRPDPVQRPGRRAGLWYPHSRRI